ncbi:MAG: hypothetical protein M1812_000036 [Candelaria pacifica]|nr:MAG: hypothetical protein M1812_000036 [Candelaria pacifica]
MAAEQDNDNHEMKDDELVPLEEWDFNFFDPDAEAMQNYEPGGYHPTHFGDLLNNGRYRIIHKLGFGSFSTVWLARDTTVEKAKYVALKIITAELKGQSSELRVLQHLATQPHSDPGLSHLLGLSDHFEVEGPNGLHDVLVLEVVGPSLKDVHPLLTLGLIKTMVFQVISAVSCLHKSGIAHGDLYPGNVAVQMTDLNEIAEDKILTQYLGYPAMTPVLTKDLKRMNGSLPKYVVRPSSFETYVTNQSARNEFHWSARLIEFGEGKYYRHLRALDHFLTFFMVIFELVFSRPLFTSSDDEEFLIYEMMGIAGPLPTSWSPYWDSMEKLDENGSPLNENDKSWRTSLADTVKGTQFPGDLAGFDEKDKSELADLLSQLLVFEPENRKAAEELLKPPMVRRLYQRNGLSTSYRHTVSARLLGSYTTLLSATLEHVGLQVGKPSRSRPGFTSGAVGHHKGSEK